MAEARTRDPIWHNPLLLPTISLYTDNGQGKGTADQLDSNNWQLATSSLWPQVFGIAWNPRNPLTGHLDKSSCRIPRYPIKDYSLYEQTYVKSDIGLIPELIYVKFDIAYSETSEASIYSIQAL